MAKDPNKPRAPRYDANTADVADRLRDELRRRGMTEAEIDAATRKRRNRKPLEFAAVIHPARSMTPAPLGEPRILAKPKPAKPLPEIRPADELCTVEFAAGRLKVHAKTVLRFLREGRLQGTRIGKSYRIRMADLEAFAGAPARETPPAEPARMTGIVDVPGVDADLAQTWARTVMGALNGKPAGDIRAEVIHDPARSHLKIVVVGAPDETVTLLNLIKVWVEQLGD